MPVAVRAPARLIRERHVGERHERLAAPDAGEVLAGRRTTGRRDLLRRSLGDDPSATRSTLWSEVDDPVSGLDDIEVVLDDEDRVAAVHEAMEHLEQLFDVGEMQARGRLVEDIEGPPGRAAGQLGRELHALRLAT